MGIEGALIALAVAGVGTGVASAALGQRAASRQADAAKGDAARAADEANLAADRERKQSRRLASQQSLAFLKNGVRLTGSPLLVLADTLKEGESQATALERRSAAFTKRGSQQASIARNQGRNAVIGGLGSAVEAGASFGINKKLLS